MSPEDAERRIRELEEELRRQKFAAEMYKDTAHAYMREHFPSEPMTEDEARRLTQDIDGRSIRDILEELERAEA
jgi:hypothetical protein